MLKFSKDHSSPRLARLLFHFRNACTFYIKTSISIQLEHTKRSSIRVMNPAWGQLLTRSNPIFRFLRRSYPPRPCIEARNFPGLLRRLSHFPEETGRDRWPRHAVCQDMPANIQLSRAVRRALLHSNSFPRHSSHVFIIFPCCNLWFTCDDWSRWWKFNLLMSVITWHSSWKLYFYFPFSNLIKFSFKIGG